LKANQANFNKPNPSLSYTSIFGSCES